MKSSILRNGIICGLVIIIAGFFWVVATGRRKAQTQESSERRIDLAMAKVLIDGISGKDKASQLISSNRLEEAQRLLREGTWWNLQSAWVVNKKYDGALDSELGPLLLDVYPRLKQQIDLGHFTNFPKSYLVEMTNFMTEADIMQSKRNNGNR